MRDCDSTLQLRRDPARSRGPRLLALAASCWSRCRSLADWALGRAWVRIIDFALLYVMLALGLNIVVGYAGLLDLGYVAFFAVGAYFYALLASPQFGLHCRSGCCCRWAPRVACVFGVLLGAPTLRLRGDYLAIVTLGFGEIIRIFLEQPERAGQHHQRPAGHQPDRPAPARRLLARADAHRSPASPFRRSTTTTTCSSRCAARRRSSSRCGWRTRASAAPGWRSARTRSRRPRWASTRAT